MSLDVLSIARKGVTVRAVCTTGGLPALNISVEVCPEVLRAEVGDYGAIDEVVAEIPLAGQGSTRWIEEHLDRIADRISAARTVEQTFMATFYGPSEASTEGFDVEIRTRAGKVLAMPHDGAAGGRRHRVHELDKP